MLGLFTGLVALLLAFMNFNYMLAGSAGVNPVYLVLAILLMLTWKNAGWTASCCQPSAHLTALAEGSDFESVGQ